MRSMIRVSTRSLTRGKGSSTEDRHLSGTRLAIRCNDWSTLTLNPEMRVTAYPAKVVDGKIAVAV